MGMDLQLNGQVAVVTGAGRGIGRGISLALGRAGGRVVLVSRTRADLDAVADTIRSEGGDATVVPADVTDETQVASLFAAAKSACGQVDILVNNAGIGVYGPIMDFAAADFDKVVKTNLNGTFLCCRAALRCMVPARSGYIINIASVVGFRGYPSQAAYTASKHGVVGFTKSLAIEAQEHGIRVSVILPGGVDTEMVRRARPDLDFSELMHPEDIAQAVAYLLSLSDRAAVDEIYVRRRNSTPF
ncbi:MAG: SDR family oxidoreductase [Lentisphaerae bacterium]|nr:SDR family oxidoreductase [Lentisphaerota bacterium]